MTLVLVVLRPEAAYSDNTVLLRSHTPPGKAADPKIPLGRPRSAAACEGGFFLSRREFLPLPPQSALFLVVGVLFIQIFNSLLGNCAKSVCKFIVSMGGKFRVSLCCRLDTMSLFLYVYLVSCDLAELT